MKEHLRRFVLAAKTKFDVDVTPNQYRGHFKCQLSKDGEPLGAITLSCTPTNADTVVLAALRDVRRILTNRYPRNTYETVQNRSR